MNKIWNSARFVLPHVQATDDSLTIDSFNDYSVQEKWLLSRLNKTIIEVERAIETYSFNDAAQCLYQFMWHEFCDWGIEEAKIPLASNDDHVRTRAAVVLKNVLDTVIRLLHPFIPFITEEIASFIPTVRNPIISGPFPSSDDKFIDEDAEEHMKILMGIIGSVRNIRAEMNISPGKALPVTIYPDCPENERLIRDNLGCIGTLAKISEFKIEAISSEVEPPKFSAAAVVGNLRIFVPLEGFLDPVAEIARLEKELSKIDKETLSTKKKLSNPDFLEKASSEAVQKQQYRLADLESKGSGMKQALDRMRKFSGL